jgi:uncharacterized coiled-coil protein SlyX
MQELKNKNMKKVLPIVLFAVITILIGSVLFEKCNNNVEHKIFLAQVDSLHKVNDSLEAEIAKDDAEIDSLDIVAIELQYKVDHQKAKVKTIVEYIEVEKNNIDGFSNPELVSSFNNRYPSDTITNPLLVAQPVLVSAAKDLVELDGAKQIIVLKDSSITTLEAKVTVKDSVIGKYANKELNYKNIILNKDKEITGWEGQYQKLELQYNKLKVKSKFQRIGSYVVIGGLAYLMLVK